jgi:hypothetical protein
MMSKPNGIFLLLIFFAVSCPGPVPLDFPTGDLEPAKFCIDFEETTRAGAINGVNAALLYGDLGIHFPSNPIIFRNPALSDGAQSLYQGDPGAARPESSCGPLEIRIHPDLLAGKVEFEARNVGFISIPVEITATAFGDDSGTEVAVDQYRKVNQSTLGDLRPVELVALESLETSLVSEPPITKVIVNYGTCPPHVTIDNLCITPKDVGVESSTDSGADRLVYYFDNRERKSYVQLANLSTSTVTVHVQIWMANSTVAICEEIDFFDTYSAQDVHTYDMLDIARNDGPPLTFGPLSGIYGFVVVSRSSGPPDSLVGVMKIIDDAGYEYRTNAVAPESASTATNLFSNINFNNANGNSFSELIGFTYTEISPDTVYASPGVSSVFGNPVKQILIIDEDENLTSCSPQVFACSDGNSNIAIDNSLPNSKLNPNRVCHTSIINAGNDAGWLQMPFSGFVCADLNAGDADNNCLFDTHFAGFVGLNNGTGSGSFDSWWEGEINDDD